MMLSRAASGAQQPQLQLLRRRPASSSQCRPAAAAAAFAAAASSALQRRRGRSPLAAAPSAAAEEQQQAATGKPEEVDLEEEVERFMRKQAELESGGECFAAPTIRPPPAAAAPRPHAHARNSRAALPPPAPQKTAAFARTRDVATVIGADAVPDDEAKRYCRAIVDALRTLKEQRDMSVAEVKLIVSIDDPRARERAVQLDVEDSRGVSRDEMAAALVDVTEGRVPRDRIALRCLHDEILEWPFLNDAAAAVPSTSGPGAGAAAGSISAAAAAAASASASSSSSSSSMSAADYASLNESGGIVKPYVMGKDARKGDKPQGLADLLPDWVGFGALYGISAIPALLAVGAILVLFYNSLR
jgi:hypothetical protein